MRSEVVTGLPFIRAELLPSAEISLEMIISVSLGTPYPLSANQFATSVESSSKMAFTTAFCVPARTMSRDVRYPKTAPIASIIIDFPAPVSPVRTLKPFSNSISQCSITATFSIWRSFSIHITPIYYESILLKLLQKSLADSAVCITRNAVSSPARVPTISEDCIESIAEHAAEARPGIVLSTTIFCALS